MSSVLIHKSCNKICLIYRVDFIPFVFTIYVQCINKSIMLKLVLCLYSNKNRHSRKYYILISYIYTHCVILLQFRNNLTTFFMMFFKQIIKSEIIECKTNIEFYKTLIVHLYVTKRIESVAVQKTIWRDATFFYYSAI